MIDVLRAFTTAPWCFESGVAAMYLARTPADALRARDNEHRTALLLKDGPPAPGFELVNSPALIRNSDLAGQTVIQQTTNGTCGVFAAFARPRALVLCSAFVATGGDEDAALAEYLSAALDDAGTDVEAFLRRVENSQAAAELRELAHRVDYPGLHEDDLPLALEVDRFARVLVAVRSGSLAQLHPLAS